MKNKLLSNNWIKSLAINIAILVVVVLCTKMQYGTNDDLAITSRILAGYPYAGFINYYLCKVLIALQGIFTTVNVYMLSQLVMSFFAFVILLKTLLDNSSSALMAGLFSAVILIFSFDHYSTIQFSKTAALLMTAALVTLIDAIIRRSKLVCYIISIVLLYLGVAYRPDGYLAALGFAFIFAVLWLIVNRKILKAQGYLSAKSTISYVVVFALLLGGFMFNAASRQANTGTEELQAARDYSEYRSHAVDFGTLAIDESNEDAFAEIGIDANDLLLIDRWHFDYDGAASLDNLVKIDNIRNATGNASQQTSLSVVKAVKKLLKYCLQSVKALSSSGIHLVLAIVLALFGFIFLKKKCWPYIIGTGAMTFLFYLLLFMMQRAVYRALYVADIGCIFWLLYTIAICSEFAHSEKSLRIGSIVMILLFACLAIPECGNTWSSFDGIKGKIISDELIQYTDNHPDELYVFATGEKKQPDYYLNPLTPPSGTGENIIGTGSWGTYSPYVFSQLAQYGVNNPIKDLINNDHAYYIGNASAKNLEEYYNKWYAKDGHEIRLVLVDTIDEYNIWKVEQ